MKIRAMWKARALSKLLHVGMWQGIASFLIFLKKPCNSFYIQGKYMYAFIYNP